MAILTGINTRLSGSAGDWTFSRLNGQTIAKQKLEKKGTPVRSSRQQRWRMQWCNILALYRAFTGHLHPSFEGKDARVSDYNEFVSANIGIVPVYLTKDEHRQGGCVVAPYQITRGGIPSIEVTDNDGIFCTDIDLGAGATITSGTTVKAFSDMVVNNNPLYDYDDQLTCFIAHQKVNAVTGVPYVQISASEVTLNASDTRRLYDLVDKKGFCASDDSMLCAEGPIEGGIAWIHSRESEAETRVSTQRFVCSNSTLSVYQSAEHLREAIESYGGVNKDAYLTPNRDTDAEIQPGV